ncbi:MAG: alpha/beta hydrolase [Nitrospiraceae bacterium]
MEQTITFLDPQSHKVSAVLTTPPSGPDRVAVLCHGFLSSKNSTTNKTLTRMLLEHHIATFRFDFFGQGESEGPFEQITPTLAVGQVMAALDLMAAKGYRRMGLVGSSFGGLVSILTAAQRTDVACLALKCPVVDFAEELRLEFGESEMAQWKATDTIPDITGGPKRVRLAYACYEDCMRQIGYAPAKTIHAPTLIVQGDEDEYVPLHQSKQLFEALQCKKRLEILPGANHQFTRGKDFGIMTSLLVDWLTTHLEARQPPSSKGAHA